MGDCVEVLTQKSASPSRDSGLNIVKTPPARSKIRSFTFEELRRAFEFARDAHAGQCRKSGEPFIIHPIEVGIILADLRMDAETITAALLHDTVEDTKVTAEEVERTFNPQVRALVEGVTKITRIEVESLTDEQAATIRKMFVAMSKDIRVIVIKLADRLHNMRTLAALREDRRSSSPARRWRSTPPSPTALASTPSSGSWRTSLSSTWSPTSTSRSPAW